MRFNRRCPKCGSPKVSEQNPSITARNAYLVLRDEDAERGQVALIDAWVCDDCGFVEFYRSRGPVDLTLAPQTA